MGTMSVLDDTGDTRLQWDKANGLEVKAAEQRFAELKARGFAAFKTDAKGDKGEQIHSFAADAERIIFVPPMVGG
jgi:hypothetical protein